MVALWNGNESCNEIGQEINHIIVVDLTLTSNDK